MIDIDLADPSISAGPPPANLLPPLWLMVVLLPIALAALAQVSAMALESEAAGLAERIRAIEADAGRQLESRRRVAASHRQAANLERLRQSASELMAAVPALCKRMPQGVRLEEIRLSTRDVVVRGVAMSAGDVSTWLAGTAEALDALEWSAPELQPGASPYGVRFEVRARRASLGGGIS